MSHRDGIACSLRRDGHPVGWLLIANGLILAAAGLAEVDARYGTPEEPGALPGSEWAVTWDQAGWPLLFAPVTALAFVFPDGRLPSSKWRRAAVGVAATFGLMSIVSLFGPEPFEAPYERVDNPLLALPSAVE